MVAPTISAIYKPSAILVTRAKNIISILVFGKNLIFKVLQTPKHNTYSTYDILIASFLTLLGDRKTTPLTKRSPLAPLFKGGTRESNTEALIRYSVLVRRR